MKNKKILFTIIGIVLLIGILFFVFKIFSISNKIGLSPLFNEINTPFDACLDADAKSSDQSKVDSYVIFFHRDAGCDLTQINKLNLNSINFCGYLMNYNDECISSTVLREKICIDNKMNTKEITCPNGCSSGRCI